MFSSFFGGGHQASAQEQEGLMPKKKPPAKVETKEGAAPPDEHESRAGFKGHHCTDIPCLVVFIAALCGIGYIMGYAVEHGDVRKVFYGFNFTGGLCGVDDPDKPFLYWCSSPNPLTLNVLDLEHPICVASCPVSNLTFNDCYQGSSTAVAMSGVAGSFQQTVTFTFAAVQDYPAFTFAYRYCLPNNTEMMSQVMEQINSNPTTSWLLELSTLTSAWPALLAAGGIAFVLSYVYLFILDKLARCIVYVSLLLLVLAPLAAGGYFLAIAFDVLHGDGIEGSGDETTDQVVGGILVGAGFALFCVVWCIHSSIDAAIGCVQAACECLFDMCSLPLLVPLISIIFKMGLLSLMAVGFLQLVSCGEVMQQSLNEYVATSSMPNVAGLGRNFTWTEDEQYMMLYFIFMIFWVAELCNACSQYVLAHCTALWYFTPVEGGRKKGVPHFALLRAGVVLVTYHLGSVAVGSFLVAALQFIRLILSYIAKQSQAGGNAAAAAAAKACMCCITCFEQVVKFLNKNAYMAVAVNSDNFCEAAKEAFEFLTGSAPAIAILNGSCFIFELCGVGVITGGAATLTYLMVINIEQFALDTSPYYVSDPTLCAGVGGLIGFLVSVSFMIVFDMVADTMLFCFAQDKKRNGEHCEVTFTPPSLQGLIDKHN